MTDALTRPRSTLPFDLGEELLGKWFWVKSEDSWLGCVTHLGSNYAVLTMSMRHGTSSVRVHFNDFDEVCTPEPDAEGYFRGQVDALQHRVAGLLEEVRRLTAGLGLTPRGTLPAPGGTSSALARVSGEGNVHAYKEALQLAKKTTLPGLFKQIQEETEAMTTWLKAPLVPLRGQVEAMRRVGAKIEDRIFTVELYAGLLEELVQVKDGVPAATTERVALFQRRHYMDEECLAHYQAGGMRFHQVDDFDAWLVRPENLDRLLPRPRCAVAFRVRRNHYEGDEVLITFADWVNFWAEAKADQRTYLYLRNGEQVYRLTTGFSRSGSTIDYTAATSGSEEITSTTFPCSLPRTYKRNETDSTRKRQSTALPNGRGGRCRRLSGKGNANRTTSVETLMRASTNRCRPEVSSTTTR